MVLKKEYINALVRELENKGLPLAIFIVFAVQEVALLQLGGVTFTVKGYLAYILDLITFLANLFWVAPQVFKTGRLRHFLLRLLLLLSVHCLLRSWLMFNQTVHSGFLSFLLKGDYLPLVAWRLEYILGLSFLIAVLKNMEQRRFQRQRLLLQLARANEEKARVESTMAQMQLSPHLILNGLSYLQAHTSEKIPATDRAIELMSAMFTASLVNIRQVQKVPLEEALAQIRNRVAFQQLLSNGRLHIVLEEHIEGSTDNVMLPPSLLMPPVENLLKYGQLNDPEFPAIINITTRGNELVYITSNLKNQNTMAGTGIGLESMRQILSYYYPKKHHFEIADNEQTYTLKLTIEL